MKDYRDFAGGRLLALAILAVVVLLPCRLAHAKGQTQAKGFSTNWPKRYKMVIGSRQFGRLSFFNSAAYRGS